MYTVRKNCNVDADYEDREHAGKDGDKLLQCLLDLEVGRFHILNF